MKRILTVILVFVCLFSMTACSSKENTVKQSSDRQTIQEPVTTRGEKILVAYFSWAENAIIDGEVDAVTSPSVTAPGNVAQMADWIQEKTGGNSFPIQVKEPYSSDWDDCLERANKERSDNARPKLKKSVENIEDYDVIFLGYPTWWYGAPMAVLSFIEENNLSGKQVYLFCSHGTGGLAESVGDIESVLPKSTELSEDIFDAGEDETLSSEQDIVNWLEKLEF
ncbi:MAG: flavodoxin [Anaerostipes sp.]|uniref:flavodoxin n=1 Tax=Anaerostipes sp. TaxID=1872530 RepID=UPI003995FA90